MGNQEASTAGSLILRPILASHGEQLALCEKKSVFLRVQEEGCTRWLCLSAFQLIPF
jgi:hypothetical protein